MPEITKNGILAQRDLIISTVKIYIDENSNLKKLNMFYPNKKNFEFKPEILDILNELNIKKNKYYEILWISNDTYFEIHLRRMTNYCFMNNYFADGLILS